MKQEIYIARVRFEDGGSVEIYAKMGRVEIDLDLWVGDNAEMRGMWERVMAFAKEAVRAEVEG